MFFSKVTFAYDYHMNTIQWQQDDENRVYFDYSGASWLQADPNAYLEVGWSKDGESKTFRFQTWELTFFPTKNGYYHAKVVKGDGSVVGENGTIISGIQDETVDTIGYDGITANTGTDPNDSGGDPDPPGGDDGDGTGDDGTGGTGAGSGGDGSGDGGDGSGTGTCENCALFECPNWSEYMGKIDEIINAIPPPPDWEQVADTFYERVVPKAIDDLDNMLKDSFLPKMMSDLENMLGTAPEPPSSPAILQPTNIPTPSSPTVEDYADTLNQAKPEMAENPDLDNATFSADDVKNEAPEIQFREDESGGFDLPMSNPVDSLPDLPFDDFPMPGMGSAGEWDHQPNIPDNAFPMPSEGSSGGSGGATDPGAPPIPNESGNEAPLPGQEYNAPIPGGTEIEIGNYKKHPDDPDGSG